jgi:hypothetical protein
MYQSCRGCNKRETLARKDAILVSYMTARSPEIILESWCVLERLGALIEECPMVSLCSIAEQTQSWLVGSLVGAVTAVDKSVKRGRSKQRKQYIHDECLLLVSSSRSK